MLKNKGYAISHAVLNFLLDSTLISRLFGLLLSALMDKNKKNTGIKKKNTDHVETFKIFFFIDSKICHAQRTYFINE